MKLTVDRVMIMQAVLDGQIGTEHVTLDELVTINHALADRTIEETMTDIINQRTDVTVFDLEWDYLNPN